MREPATMVYGTLTKIVDGERVVIAENQPLYMAAPTTLTGSELIDWANRREAERRRLLAHRKAA